MKIVVFNLRYGANLGDQLIARCLSEELRAAAPTFDIHTEDLAGRSAVQTGVGSRGARMAALTILQALPSPARRLFAGLMLGRLVRKRLEPRWRKLLADADAVVIGGGGLFADSDLNFPIKIGAVLRMAAERQLPVAIHAVGVSPGWSKRGTRLFGDGLERSKLRSITVRDAGARKIWQSELGNYKLPPIGIAPDPALTLTRHLAARATSETGTIGLCLTSPKALRYQSGSRSSHFRIDQWYLELARELTQRGYRVVGFTTGAVEDSAFSANFERHFNLATKGRGYVAGDSPSATDLTDLIATFSGVVAHRLHALIIGYSLGIPGLALAWDQKMLGQMEAMGVADRLVDPAKVSPSALADRLRLVVASGIDTSRRDALAKEASCSTMRLIKALQADGPAHD